MAYNVKHSDSANYGGLIVEDKTINDDTSLSLVGRYYPGYSKPISENFLHLLENFASNIAPLNPIRGQLWYDTDSTSASPTPKLMMWDGGKWVPSGSINRAFDRPTSPSSGDLWVNPTTHTLEMYIGNNIWTTFLTDITGGTGIKIITVNDGSADHELLVAYINDIAVAIFNADDEFTPTNWNNIESFVDMPIKKGINIPDTYQYNGIAEQAVALKYGTSTKTINDLFIKNEPNTTSGTITVNSDSGITVNDTNISKTIKIKIDDSLNYNILSSSSDLLISSNDASSSITTVSLLANSVDINKPVNINGLLTPTSITTGDISSTTGITSAAFVDVGSTVFTSATGIFPKTTATAIDLGDPARNWTNIYTKSLYANTVGTQNVTVYYGSLHNTVTYNNNEILSSGTTFTLSTDLTGTSSGTGSNITIAAILSGNVISNKPAITAIEATDKMLVESSGSLKSVTFENVIKSASIVGEVVAYAGNTVPDKFKECNGLELSKTAYPELFAVIGTTFGVPSISTNFKLPNITQLTTNVKYYIYAGKN